jgi:hypothetical protein
MAPLCQTQRLLKEQRYAAKNTQHAPGWRRLMPVAVVERDAALAHEQRAQTRTWRLPQGTKLCNADRMHAPAGGIRPVAVTSSEI